MTKFKDMLDNKDKTAMADGTATCLKITFQLGLLALTNSFYVLYNAAKVTPCKLARCFEKNGYVLSESVS